MDTATKLGTFEVKISANQTGWFNAGFYALAYLNASTNETVIAYRGTDFNANSPFSGDPIFSDPDKGGSDLINGYGLAFGLPGQGEVLFLGGSPRLTAPQGGLAEAFYNTVLSTAGGSVTLTGHSLGGGLAEYIGAVTNSTVVLFEANDNALAIGIAA